MHAYHVSIWLKDVLEVPFIAAQFKSFTEKRILRAIKSYRCRMWNGQVH